MTDLQLYLAIGIPSMIACLGILVNVGYFVAINGRLNSLEVRLDGRINTLESKLDTQFGLLMSKVVEIDNRVLRMEDRLGIK